MLTRSVYPMGNGDKAAWRKADHSSLVGIQIGMLPSTSRWYGASLGTGSALPLLQRRVGYAVAQSVEALCYKLEGRRFNSRWVNWNFSLT